MCLVGCFLTLSCVALRVCGRGPGREPQVGEREAAGEHPWPEAVEHATSQKQLVPRSRTGQKQVEFSALEDRSREY